MGPRTSVSPEGRFIVGIHEPGFTVHNLREKDFIARLGHCQDGLAVENQANFPLSSVTEPKADRIYEVANAFPFRGTTFINSAWADRHAGRPETVTVPGPPPCSLTQSLREWQIKEKGGSDLDPRSFLAHLPRPLRLALAQASSDPEELAALAALSCTLELNGQTPTGIVFVRDPDGRTRPDIQDHDLYDILGNNPALPDAYKEVMVLRPGIQGTSEIVGEFSDQTHVFEYLRRNSYIPWGHFAANMANDQIRYRARDLTPQDMTGIRHLYYQRVFIRLADQLGLNLPRPRTQLSCEALEDLRSRILKALEKAGPGTLEFNAALWGWNFGFGFAQSGHRLHASHQMIHQQNAMVRAHLPGKGDRQVSSFSAGDLVTDFIRAFRLAHKQDFFSAYLQAIRTNERTDQDLTGPQSLIVHEDENVLLFAPKAQVSEWELNLMTKAPCPHILAADTPTRSSLDQAMLKAVQALETLGARMITAVEFSGRFDQPWEGQHLIYSFIPRLPYAPQTFSEAQLRWITGCFPEDFAMACRQALSP